MRFVFGFLIGLAAAYSLTALFARQANSQHESSFDTPAPDARS